MSIKKLITSIVLITTFNLIHAQQSTTAGGGDASGSGGTVAYSIGQVVYFSYNGTNGSISQGVQQPYEISTVLGVEKNQISLNMKAYPNPTIDYLILNVGDCELSSLNYHLFDISGKLIESKKITSEIETISMDNLPITTYILKVENHNKEVKIFKIIKN